NLRCGFSEPGFEASLAEPCGILRHERSEAQLRPRVTRFRVRDDFAWILELGQLLLHQFVKSKRFRACYFDRAIYRRTYGDPGYATSDILGSHRLEKHRRQTHLLTIIGNVGEALEELEKLRGVHDRVGDSGVFDQFFLSDFGPEVTAFRQPIGSHNR